MPSPFFWGGFGKSLGEGVTNTAKLLNEQQKIKAQQEHLKLQDKMINQQIEEHKFKQTTAEEQKKATQDLSDLYTKGVSETHQPLEPGEYGPEAPPITYRPATNEEKLGAMFKAQPKETTTGVLKQQLGTGKTPRLGGYDSLSELQADAAKFGYPLTAAKQDPFTGKWMPEFRHAVNTGSDLAHSAAQLWLRDHPGDYKGANQARQDTQDLFNYHQAGSRTMGDIETKLAGQGTPLPNRLPGAPEAPLPTSTDIQNRYPAPTATPGAGQRLATPGAFDTEKQRQSNDFNQLGVPPPPEAGRLPPPQLPAAPPVQKTAQPSPGAFPTPSNGPSRASALETQKNLGRPLEVSDRQAVGTMEQSYNIAQQLSTKFTPEERAKYVGFLNFPAHRLAQIAKNDPRFADFQVLVARAKKEAFGEGGKQLTPFEAEVVFGYIPTGTEFSSADFEAKLATTLQQTRFLRNKRVELGQTPRGNIQPLPETPSPSSPVPGSNTKIRRFNPATGRIE